MLLYKDDFLEDINIIYIDVTCSESKNKQNKLHIMKSFLGYKATKIQACDRNSWRQ